MSFADDVRRGLSARPKSLPSKYLYDPLGSALFDAIAQLPEYYLTRAEAEILAARAQAIVGAVDGTIELVELGSGSAVKTRVLIDAIFRRQPALTYRPIDISTAALAQSRKALNAEYPGLSVDGYAAEYREGLRHLRHTDGYRTFVLFLGSNIGNFEPDEAVDMLRAVRAAVRRGDHFLLGADLKKDKAVLEAAYADPLGVTAAFNRNILGRINRELGGHFDLSAFAHRAFYNEAAGRIEMHLVSEVPQHIRIDELKMTAMFETGESVHTENSYKYDAAQINNLARQSGFTVVTTWTDAAGRFSSNLLIAG